MKKVIIILTQPIENNTSSMIRSMGIIKELPNLGYETVCYCPYPDINSRYNDGSRHYDNIIVKRFGKKEKIQITSIDVSSPKGIKKKIIALAYRCFKKVDLFGASLQYLKYRKSLKHDIKREGGDILLTFSDPKTSHIIGKYCRDVVKEKYIQQWGDPLTMDITSKTILPRWLRKNIEGKMIKKADCICYVSPLTCDEQKKLFRKYANKMIFLPTPRVDYPDRSSKKPHNKIKVGYFGSYNSLARNIRPLYEAICESDKHEFYLIGDSDIMLESKNNIIIKNRISQENMDKYVEDMDVLVCLMNSKGNQIPGKMYHYAGSYKEILVIKDGEYGNEIEKYFKQFDRYTFVKNDKDKIKEILNEYSIQKVPVRYPLDDFSASTIANKLLKNC